MGKVHAYFTSNGFEMYFFEDPAEEFEEIRRRGKR